MPGEVPIETAKPQTREAVACPHFGPCGGCDYLDRPYGMEMTRKVRELRDALERQPRLAKVEVLPLLAAKEPLFYRTALKVPFGVAGETPVAGFFRRGTHSIVDLETCAIQHPLLTEFLVTARELVKEIEVPIYREYLHKGVLRHLLARVAPGTGESLIGLVVRKAGAPQVRRLGQALFERFESRGLVGVVENLNEERTNVVVGEVTKPMFGRPYLDEEQDGLRFRTSIDSFVQVNAAQASELFAEVIRQLGDGNLEGRHVCDLFSGFGPIALRLAKAGARVTAIERNRQAVRDGAAAARANGLDERVRFLAADAFVGLHRVDADGLDALVVDPPRRGLSEELIDLLLELRFRRMVYVSCNPDTLLRDLLMLHRGFDVKAIRPVDLFPRTAHLEAVVSLVRR
jgi:23S rRNA (uracil1939-C5)-methyltransferase